MRERERGKRGGREREGAGADLSRLTGANSLMFVNICVFNGRSSIIF